MESSSSTSSIGKNSDDESVREGEEVESNLTGGALSSLQALEQVLPIKRSLSQFQEGKSKSFNNLRDAEACSSVREIAKPENAYSRRRKNLLAHHCLSERNRLGVRKSKISKRHAKSRSMSTAAATVDRGQSCNNGDSSNPNLPSPDPSLSDLQGVAADTSIPEKQ